MHTLEKPTTIEDSESTIRRLAIKLGHDTLNKLGLREPRSRHREAPGRVPAYDIIAHQAHSDTTFSAPTLGEFRFSVQEAGKVEGPPISDAERANRAPVSASDAVFFPEPRKKIN